MSSRRFRCGTGLDNCPHAATSNPFTLSDEEYDAWVCPNSKYCKDNLIELSWLQANPGARRAMIFTASLLILGIGGAGIFFGVFSASCGRFKAEALGFRSEVNASVSRGADSDKIQEYLEGRVGRVVSVEEITTAKDESVIAAITDKLQKQKSELVGAANQLESAWASDRERAERLLDKGIALKARSQARFDIGETAINDGISATGQALEQLKEGSATQVARYLSYGNDLIANRVVQATRQRDQIQKLVADNQRREQEIRVQAERENSQKQQAEVARKSREQAELNKIEEVRGLPLFLRISCDPGLGDKLLIPLAVAFADQRLHAKAESFQDGSTRRVYWSQGGKAAQQIEIVEQPSGVGFASLGNQDRTKHSDLEVSYREPTQAEVTALAKIGDLTSPDCAQVIALDAVCLLVNANNPATQLTEQQLNQILSGQFKSWDSDGGNRQPISLVIPKADGAESVVNEVFGPRIKGPHFRIANNEVDNTIGEDTGRLGLAAYSSSPRGKRLAIQAAERTRILEPSKFTVATEDYKYTARIIACHAATAPAGCADFMRFLISGEGQTVVGKCGFVDLNVKAMPVADEGIIAPLAEASRPRKLRDAERLSTNLRFKTGKWDLDLKATGDIRRVVDRLAEPDMKGRQLAVIGFADSRGGDQINFPLSEQRAEEVVKKFEQCGVRSSVKLGLGSRLPIDTNDTEEGMERNRRVELWILRFEEGIKK